MSAGNEVRIYRAKPSMAAPLLELLRSRAFPDEPSRPPLEAGFYDLAHA
jgi:hypothetical protein